MAIFGDAYYLTYLLFETRPNGLNYPIITYETTISMRPASVSS